MIPEKLRKQILNKVNRQLNKPPTSPLSHVAKLVIMTYEAMVEMGLPKDKAADMASATPRMYALGWFGPR